MAVRPPTRTANGPARSNGRPPFGAPPTPTGPPPALPDAQRLLALLSGPVQDAGVLLEDVQVSRAGRRAVVSVVVDAAGDAPALDLDQVAVVSRVVNDVLDAAPSAVVPGAITLEVSTPGVERPLRTHGHWVRAISRLVKVQRHGASTLTGRVCEVQGEVVVLEVPGPKGRGATTERVAIADVATAVVQVEFSRPDAPDSSVDQHDVEDAGEQS
jgi:ribosome maturation factor RimP